MPKLPPGVGEEGTTAFPSAATTAFPAALGKRFGSRESNTVGNRGHVDLETQLRSSPST